MCFVQKEQFQKQFKRYFHSGCSSDNVHGYYVVVVRISLPRLRTCHYKLLSVYIFLFELFSVIRFRSARQPRWCFLIAILISSTVYSIESNTHWHMIYCRCSTKRRPPEVRTPCFPLCDGLQIYTTTVHLGKQSLTHAIDMLAYIWHMRIWNKKEMMVYICWR